MDKLFKHYQSIEVIFSKRHVVLLCLTLVVYIITLAIYRILFHTLSRRPGPLFAKISGWPNWYHASKGDRHVWLSQLHKSYGDCVRFTPSSISLCSPSALTAIYTSRRSSPIIKSDWYQTVRDSAGGFESTFTAIDKSRHGVKRRLLSHAFSDQALNGYEEKVRGTVKLWSKKVDEEASNADGVVDLGEWSNYLIFDILGQLCFGKAFGTMDDPEKRYVVDLVPKGTRSWYTLGYHPLTHLYRYLLFKTRLGPFIGGQSYRDNQLFRQFCINALKERREAEKTRSQSETETEAKDMFHHLLHGRDPETGQAYSTGDLACESVLLIVAGSQSTSGALAATLFYLAHPRYRDKLRKLAHEVRGAFASAEDIRYDFSPTGTLANLEYLRACIDEAMRLTPPTPGHLPRTVVGEEGLTIISNSTPPAAPGCRLPSDPPSSAAAAASSNIRDEALFFPSGTILGVSAYALHHSPFFTAQPDLFWPERWIERDHDGRLRYADEGAFCPFSAGRTGCIGKRLAYVELCLAVAAVVWRWELRLVDEVGRQVVVEEGDDGDGDGEKTLPPEYHVKDVFVGLGAGPRVGLREWMREILIDQEQEGGR